MTVPDPIERELTAAQRAYIKAIARRRAAVVAAYRPGPHQKSIYRIAKLLGVEERTIRSILKTAADLEQKGEKSQ